MHVLVKDATIIPCAVDSLGQSSNLVTHKVRESQSKFGSVLCTESRHILHQGIYIYTNEGLAWGSVEGGQR